MKLWKYLKEIMDKFDEIDVGNYILSKFKLDMSREEEIGKIILIYFLDKHNGYKTIKKDISKYLNTLMFLFNEEDIMSDTFVKFSEDAVLKYRIFKLTKPLEERYEFIIKDFSNVCNKFIIVDKLESFNNGAGRKLMTEFLENVKGIPVILTAGVTSKGLYENGDIDEQLNKLETFYKSLGFININDKCGCYEEQISMLKINGGHIDERFLNTIRENR